MLEITRFRGGFRRLAITELGSEQQCCSCGEFWPADEEFYVVRERSLGYECKACISERRKKATNYLQSATPIVRAGAELVAQPGQAAVRRPVDAGSSIVVGRAADRGSIREAVRLAGGEINRGTVQ